MIFPTHGYFPLNSMNSSFQNVHLDENHILLAQVELMVSTMPMDGHVGWIFSSAWL